MRRPWRRPSRSANGCSTLPAWLSNDSVCVAAVENFSHGAVSQMEVASRHRKSHYYFTASIVAAPVGPIRCKWGTNS